MFRIKQIVDISKYCNKHTIRFISKNASNKRQFVKSEFTQSSKNKEIGGLGWFLLLVPATTFALGTWQVQRKKWKENLILDLQNRSNSKAVSLPEDLSELKDLEYYPVYVKGEFVHDKELYLGPRSLLIHGDASTQGGLMSKNQSKNTGYLVITPFKLADREYVYFKTQRISWLGWSKSSLTILVNRGWVSTKTKDQRTRKEGQVKGEVELIGVVRLQENRPTFIPNNNPEANSWFYRDIQTMANQTNAEPVFLDVISEFDVPGGPKGGQTRVTLRNEHLSYILTWYSLCGFTSFMWFRQFIQKLPPI